MNTQESSERYTASTPVAVVAKCLNLNGSPKAELIRRLTANPISAAHFGRYSWEVWHDCEPDSVTRFKDEEQARKAFDSACLHGTNGRGA